MVKKVLSIFMCLMMLIGTSLVLAGGAPVAPGCGPYQGMPYVPSAPYSNYWGDAPFPGLCGGVVALPFLVVGSLLGGNTIAPYPGPMGGGYNCPPRQYPPNPCVAPPCPPPTACAPAPRPYVANCAPAYASCGPTYGGVFGGLPCLDVCAGLLGAVTGGVGLLP